MKEHGLNRSRHSDQKQQKMHTAAACEKDLRVRLAADPTCLSRSIGRSTGARPELTEVTIDCIFPWVCKSPGG